MTAMGIEAGQVYTFEKVCQHKESAAALGSGGLEVFSTPSLVALFEATAKRGVDPLLPPGHSTVGTEISVKHLKATPIGRRVRCVATVTAVEGRRIRFSGEMSDDEGPIGTGTQTRHVVDDAEFLRRIGL